jgi:hypothetical protein
MLEWWRRFRNAQVAHDWNALGALLAADAHFTSMQKGLHVEMHSREEYLSFAMAIYDRDHDWEVELLAAQGEWCVARLHVFGPGDDEAGPWEVDRIALVQIDADCVSPRTELYDISDRSVALQRLDEVAGT